MLKVGCVVAMVLGVALSGCTTPVTPSIANKIGPATSSPPAPQPPSSPVDPPPPTAADFPPPKAVLHVTFEGHDTPGIKGVPMLFDASDSTGEQLKWVIDFGDGLWTQAPWEDHVVNTGAGSLAATATVTDRFGRSNTITTSFSVLSLQAQTPYNYWNGSIPAGHLNLTFGIHEGRQVSGYYNGASKAGLNEYGSFTGAITGGHDLHLRLVEDASAKEFLLDGSILPLDPLTHAASLRLTGTGGWSDGQVFRFYQWGQ